MNRTSVLEQAIAFPWRQIRLFVRIGSLIFQNEPVAGVAPVFPVAGFLFNEPRSDQIMQGALDGATGELQVGRNSLYCWPAVRPFPRTVAKIHINSSRPMGKLIGRGGIKMVEIAHGYPPLRFKHCAAAHGIFIRLCCRRMKCSGSGRRFYNLTSFLIHH